MHQTEMQKKREIVWLYDFINLFIMTRWYWGWLLFKYFVFPLQLNSRRFLFLLRSMYTSFKFYNRLWSECFLDFIAICIIFFVCQLHHHFIPFVLILVLLLNISSYLVQAFHTIPYHLFPFSRKCLTCIL